MAWYKGAGYWDKQFAKALEEGGIDEGWENIATRYGNEEIGSTWADWRNVTKQDYLQDKESYGQESWKDVLKTKSRIAKSILPGMTRDWFSDYGSLVDENDELLMPGDTGNWFSKGKKTKQKLFDELGIKTASDEILYNRDIDGDGTIGVRTDASSSYNPKDTYQTAAEKLVAEQRGELNVDNFSDVNWGNFQGVNFKGHLIDNQSWTEELADTWAEKTKRQKWQDFADALDQTIPIPQYSDLGIRGAKELDFAEEAEAAGIDWEDEWSDLGAQEQLKKWGFTSGQIGLDEIRQGNYEKVNWERKFADQGWADAVEDAWDFWDTKEKYQVAKEFQKLADDEEDISFDALSEALQVSGAETAGEQLEDVEEAPAWEYQEPEPVLYTEEDIWGDAATDDVWGFADIYESGQEGVAATGETDTLKEGVEADWLGKLKGMEEFEEGDVMEGGVPFQADWSTRAWTNLGSKIAKGWSSGLGASDVGLGITPAQTQAAKTGSKFKGTKQFATRNQVPVTL